MVEKINEIIKEYDWMDFEVSNGGMNRLLMHGFLDELDEEDAICIEFQEVEVIQCKTHFTYEGKGNLIEEIQGQEAYLLNSSYSVLRGNRVFKVINTDVEASMYIIAKHITVQNENV